MERKTPYQRLMKDALEFANKVRYAHTKEMWFYPKERLKEGWSLDDLAERVAAAEQLEYDVILKVENGNLKVLYRKKYPPTPMDWGWEKT